MNYKKIYDAIITKAKNEKRIKNKECYYEKHHILPKCLGGLNNKDNLVLLKAKEHFLCHWLLHLMYPENNKLLHAFHLMCYGSENQNRYVPSARVYEYLKLEKSRRMRGDMNLKYWKGKKRLNLSGENHPFNKNPDLKKQVSEKLKNHLVSDETKLKISLANKNQKPWNKGVNTGCLSDEHKEKISLANKGKNKRPMSDETKNKIRKIQLENSSSARKIVQKDKNGVVMVYDSVSQAMKINNFSSSIFDCLKGKVKKYKGFTWEYL